MDEIKNKIIAALKEATKMNEIVLEVPPKSDMGDFAFPCFVLAKELKKAPPLIAKEISEKLKQKLDKNITTKVLGPYVNFFIEKSAIAESTVSEILKEKENYGFNKSSNDIILVESPGPNTNKPLHLGHLRNILLGNSISNLLKTQGNEVHIINIVNDRGVHICKSMLAYEKFGKNSTPEKAKKKSDHFVGDFYVKYAQAEKDHPELEEEIQAMLVKWEKGDKETKKLWEQMNRWALDGFKQTYKKLNFKIEKEYYESDSYMHGKDIIMAGFEKKQFQKDEEGNIIIDLESKNLGKKVLLRANGTSIYITQDIYVAKKRYDDYKFDQMVYVVGNEQEYHFKVLFEVFKKLGWKFGDKCYHFSYGMVELPEGKMKSREGNVIDTDELIEEMIALAKDEVKSRYKDLEEREIEKRANAIGMAAIRLFFLKFDPMRNFIFNPKESLSFEGETGPYLLYAYARICSIFKKLESKIEFEKADLTLLNTDLDRRMMIVLANYPTILADSAKQFKPSALCHYLIEVASTFNEYYRDNPILKETEQLRNARLALIECVRIILKSGLTILGIDVLEQM